MVPRRLTALSVVYLRLAGVSRAFFADCISGCGGKKSVVDSMLSQIDVDKSVNCVSRRDSMDPQVRKIGGVKALPRNIFGSKATNLHELAISEKCAPEAFAIGVETVSRIGRGNCEDRTARVLKLYLTELLSKSQSKTVIVRSSSVLEDMIEHQFPGLFRSVPGVTDFIYMIEAIRACYGTSQSSVIADYCKMLGVEMPSQHLAVIVQEEITCDYSAVAEIGLSGCLVELYKGQLTYSITGDATPTVIDFNYELAGEAGELVPKSNPQNIGIDTTRMTVAALASLGKRLIKIWTLPVVLELGFRGKECFVFQIRPVKWTHRQISDKLNKSRAETLEDLLPLEKTLGRKAAAMKFFRDQGLFTGPMTIIFPNQELKYPNPAFDDLDPQGFFTIRFSYKTELGLPRLFVREKSDIVPAISIVRRPEWSIIVHQFIDVRNSFELLLSHDETLVEHVPGIWESENRLPPDVLQIDGCRTKGWLWTQSRNATVAHVTGSTSVIVEPMLPTEAEHLASRLRPIIDRLFSAFRRHLPINIHFVEDSAGRWFFLNIRHGFSVGKPKFVSLPVHIVERPEHLLTWNGKSSLLLRLSTARGKEKDLLPLIKLLPPGKEDIFIDGGILSHPAMVLQEKGITVIPAYLASPALENMARYQEVDMKTDVGSDPINRIMGEEGIYTDHHFKVVVDRDPIVDRHLLLISCQDAPSFADLNPPSLLVTTLQNQSIRSLMENGPWVILERGRAEFCTSAFTTSRAHGHILPIAPFKTDLLKEFVATTGAKHFSSLASGLEFVRHASSEYLLFSVNGEEAYVATPNHTFMPGKRFIRTFLSERLSQ
jgi:diadenosine tetraphosphate (Ap4A) HIT family hydrolase